MTWIQISCEFSKWNQVLISYIWHFFLPYKTCITFVPREIGCGSSNKRQQVRWQGIINTWKQRHFIVQALLLYTALTWTFPKEIPHSPSRYLMQDTDFRAVASTEETFSMAQSSEPNIRYKDNSPNKHTWNGFSLWLSTHQSCQATTLPYYRTKK